MHRQTVEAVGHQTPSSFILLFRNVSWQPRNTSWLDQCAKRWRRIMPTYNYRCDKCGKAFERTETISEHEKAKLKCPKCKRKVTAVPSRVYVMTSKKS